jgi:biliverdin reductase
MPKSLQFPLRVGLVGTGFAAKVRGQSLLAEPRASLVAMGGNDIGRTAAFAAGLGVDVTCLHWRELVRLPELDLVFVCSRNSEHAAVVKAALERGKHVVVEYPLALSYAEGKELVELARQNDLFLHVEHIELLGSLHQTLKEYVDRLGEVHYARYSTIFHQDPAPRKWTFSRVEFGFPLIAALSRLHRFTDLFGSVATVSCQHDEWGGEGDYYDTCLTTAQLRFSNGTIGEVVYGKGTGLWLESRKFEIQGSRGALVFEGEKGALIESGKTTPLELSSRRGLFAKDTTMILDFLESNQPLYVRVEDSLATLQVADAAERSSLTKETVSRKLNGEL